MNNSILYDNLFEEGKATPEQKKENLNLSQQLEQFLLGSDGNKVIAQRDDSHPLEVSNIQVYDSKVLLSAASFVNSLDKNKRVSQETADILSGKFFMTAIVNGQLTAREISRKDYNKFFALDDSRHLAFFNHEWGLERNDTAKVPDILQQGFQADVKYGPKDEVLKIEINGRMNEVKDVKAQIDEDGQPRMWFTLSIGEYVMQTGVDISREQYNNFQKMTPEERLMIIENGLTDSVRKHGHTIKSVNSWIDNTNSDQQLSNTVVGQKPVANWNVGDLSNRVSVNFEQLSPESEDLSVGLRR